jgi:hypothetical protein
MVVGAHLLDLGGQRAATIPPRDLPIRDIIARIRHDGCGGRVGKITAA